MTSRRSRLKAVANLPVRRKPTSSQDTNEEIQQVESTTSEKQSPTTLMEENKLSDTNLKCLNTIETITEEDFFKGIKSPQNSVCNNIEYKHLSQEICLGSDNMEITDKAHEQEAKNTNIKYSSNWNFNETIESSKQTKSDSLLSIKHAKPNFVFPQQKDQSDSNVFNLSDNNHINFVDDDLNSTTLNSQNVTVTSATNYLNATPTSLISATSNSHCINPNHEEVEVYNELVKPTEIFITSCAFTSNDINETSEPNQFLMDTESSEPIFTTLANLNVSKDIDEVNLNYLASNMPNENNDSQNVLFKPGEKNVTNKFNVMENELLSKSSYISVKEKSLKENSVTIMSQNITADPESLNFVVKRSISMLKKKRPKCNDFTKKLADARREFQKKFEKSKPDRSTLKMIDLIFYNPSTNPMESKNKQEKKGVSFIQEDLQKDVLAEEDVDDPEAEEVPFKKHSFDEKDIENMNQMPVPQVKIGINGEIILDEKSLVIETTEAKKGREDLQNSIPVFEDRGSKVSYYRGKTKKTRDWTDLETKRFYKALNTIGPDFSLMQKYFPKRSRLELKNKFKREERLNRNLIDKALNNPSEFDMTQLEEDLAVEKKAEVEFQLHKKFRNKTIIKKQRRKSSHLSREMMELDEEPEHNESINFNSKIVSQNEKIKKKKEISFILQKIILKESEKEINELSDISSVGAI